MYREELSHQLALDYCCTPEEVTDSGNHFTIYSPREGRRRFQEGAVCGLKEDNRFDEAFAFDPYAPDVLGIAAVRNGEILGMAGASADSPLFWQIGINVDSHAVGMHVGSTLVRLLAQDIIVQGAVPYYGTSMSHIASQRVAHRAGFTVAWAELIAEEIKEMESYAGMVAKS